MPETEPTAPGHAGTGTSPSDDITVLREHLVRAQRALLHNHDLSTGVVILQQRMDTVVRVLTSESEELRRERDRVTAQHEQVSALGDQLSDVLRRLESANSLSGAVNHRLRTAQRHRRLAEKLRDRAADELRRSRGATGEELPPPAQEPPTPRTEVGLPWEGRTASADLPLLGPADRHAVETMLTRIERDLAAESTDLAVLETDILDHSVSLWTGDGHSAGRPAGEARRVRNLRVLALLGALLLGSGATVAVITAQGRDDGPVAAAGGVSEASGELTCSSGSRVVGVWLQGTSVHGWAEFRNTSDGKAEYSYKVPRGERYSLHIGCGGTPEKWLVDPHTSEVDGTRNSFDCFDVQSAPHYKFCRKTDG
ncbi:hypothetical protein ACFVJI_22265 [Streptomyces sp. NPDC127584]|uniref:hypothetical protein n=1 Tax=Streptomyces sp. NPDC127584 TaxID=3345403 RepID=UPI003641A520